jgi:CubicO group peptidase (beta-lactamase class C family)
MNHDRNRRGWLVTCWLILATLLVAHCGDPYQRRFVRLDKVVEPYVKDEKVVGAVALILHDGKPVYERAFGWADRESGRPMKMDTIFRIASQTKAVTTVAALMLIEEGKLKPDALVAKYIPSFYWAKVAEKDETKPVINPHEPPVKLVPPHRPMTIHHLLTHTSGLSYGTHPNVAPFYKKARLGAALGAGWYLADQYIPICQIAEKIGTLPLSSHPGSYWVYGYSTDVLGCIVERASGMKLDEFFRQRITQKLGMKDTHFFLPPADRGRIAALYGSKKDSKPERSPVQGAYIEGPRRTFSGGAGLLSTAYDYAIFLEMIRNGGALGETRLLKPETVALMSQDQVGERYGGVKKGFGYGFETNYDVDKNGAAALRAYGWAGAYGTYYRVFPKEKLSVILLVQLYPNRTDLRDKFMAEIQAAVDKLH